MILTLIINSEPEVIILNMMTAPHLLHITHQNLNLAYSYVSLKKHTLMYCDQKECSLL